MLVPVSLITVNYNAGALLESCVLSGLNQASEVIVVDNASSDDSLVRLEASCRGEGRLRIVRNRQNIGFAAASNIGARAACGRYLLFLNPDCFLERGSLACLIQALEGNPETGMVGGLLLDPDGTEQGGGRRAAPTPGRSLVRAFGLSRLAHRWPRLFFDFHLHKQPLPDCAVEVEAVSGACMLVRREALEGVGPLDEGYFMHCEDLDWCMRFRQQGWKILFVPDAKIVHHKGTCSRSRPIFVEWHKHKGMMRYYRKFFRHQYPGILMWLVGAGVWLRFAAVAGYYSLQEMARWLGLKRG